MGLVDGVIIISKSLDTGKVFRHLLLTPVSPRFSSFRPLFRSSGPFTGSVVDQDSLGPPPLEFSLQRTLCLGRLSTRLRRLCDFQNIILRWFLRSPFFVLVCLYVLRKQRVVFCWFLTMSFTIITCDKPNRPML